MSDATVLVSTPVSVTIVNTAAITSIVAGSSNATNVIASIGAQGPQGPVGPSSGAIQKIAAINVGGHKAVILDTLGQVTYADNTNSSHIQRVIGITTGAASIGSLATVQTYGEILETSWAWTLNLPVYVGTSGNLTQIPPVSPNFAMVIGFPIASTILFVKLKEPIILA